MNTKWLIWAVSQGAWLGEGGRGYVLVRKDAGRWEYANAVALLRNMNTAQNMPTFAIIPEEDDK